MAPNPRRKRMEPADPQPADSSFVGLARVTATFNPADAAKRVTFSTDKDIEFKTEIGTVTFKLEVKTALEVRFPSNPIQWVEEVGKGVFRPVDPPSAAAVSRSDDLATVKITAPPGDTTFRFFVIVQSADGRFFGSDPTIVTMRPPG
jgi:hypothetical protein